MAADLSKLDDMWHTFLLFTLDYTKFCDRYFGRYLHHVPKTARDPKVSQRKRLDQMRAFYEAVYDVLGEETFREWFFEKRFAKARKSRTSARGNHARTSRRATR